ncbi:hypothetical protein DPMN_069107 [Dreissena polymorpha]|nr:hypothetical protein DPMN_069107 [Dreissena polymorpha]
MSRNAMKIGRYTLEHKSENIREVTKARVEDSETIATPSRSSSNLTDMEQPAPQPSSPISIEDIIIKSFSFALSPDNLYDDDLQISDTEESCVNNFMIQGTDLAGTDTSGLESKPGPSLKEMEQIVKILTKANKETSEELAISQEEIQRVHTSVLENYQLKSQVFGLMKPISIQEYLEFYKSTGIDVDGRGEELITAILHFQKKIVESVKFAKTIPGFRQLCPDDQASLLKASRVDIDIICTYKYMYHCHNVERQVIITPWGGKYHIDELEKVFPRDLVLGRNKAVRSLYELGLSEHEEAVVKAFVVMSPDRCELREPEKVQESQDKLLSCLRHLFNIRPGGTGTRLYKLFDILTYFRSLFERETEFVKTVKVHAPDYLYDDKFALIREFVL